MNSILRKLKILVFFLLVSGYFSQGMAQISTVGKEFWVGFMENNSNLEDGVAVIIISANEDASGVIDLNNFQAGRTVAFDLQAGQQFTLRVPAFEQDFLHRNSGIIENKGIFIQSDGNISVYAFNERFRSADGTVILPTATLGKDYYITSHFEVTPEVPNANLNINNESLFLVVAIEDNTRIQITPTQTTIDGKQANEPFEITLNTGQSYQIKARADLTGTRVRVVGDDVGDCKNIAVFGGNKWTSVGRCGLANDHLFQQMFPVNTWGDEFIHVPFKNRSSGELVKVLAAEDNTEIFLDGVSVGVINAGAFRTFDFASNQVVFIHTSKPASVTVFSKSQSCNVSNLNFAQIGDPFMITYSPNQQFIKNITFEAVSVQSITSHIVNVIVPTSAINGTVLNGNNVASEFLPVNGNPEFSYARINIFAGTHRLSNPDGFIAYVYGFGEIESYGYSVGASLDNLNFETFAAYEFEVLGERIACLDQEALWTLESDNPVFGFFQWDFGDGSAIETGEEISHVYETPGRYTVTVTASISENTCDQQEEVVFEVEVLKSMGELEGPSSVCPLVDEVIYQLVDGENIDKIEWQVIGGELIEEMGQEVKVKWAEATENAKIIAIPFTEQGCPGSPIEKTVIVNQQIEPDPPVGETDICFNPESTYFYQTAYEIPGRAYQWFVEGGEIVSGEEGTRVEISWNQPGVVGQVWYEESSLLDAMCEGRSMPLSVSIPEAFSVSLQSVSEVLCFGEQTGGISLLVEGGKGPFLFEWNHDPALNTSMADNLRAGNYAVTITDDNGCSVVLEEIIIEEPMALTAEVVVTESVSCFGKADGLAQIQIAGGLGPYTLNTENALVSGSDITLSDLEAGEYNLTLMDANSCTFAITFEIPSPLPLDVEVKLLQPSCPGGSNGILLAEISGDFGPYVYTWDIDQTTGQEISDLPKGMYAVSVEDRNGCISLGAGEVLEAAPKVRMPTGFRPKDGGINAIYQGVSNCEVVFTLFVYNRWGELVYSGNQGWDGSLGDGEAPEGSYSYLFRYQFFLDEALNQGEIRGVFLLLR
ncbi:PKD domain-containing protein [Pararhodonellum marinum]|uniref:PKD domain-containing protein n=1 Tax=Pararhodonellum marinum TaxID=2755358 RepID=UPI00188F50DD|nr:PKD domain-containing protein [Pararhodonellum marinum]